MKKTEVSYVLLKKDEFSKNIYFTTKGEGFADYRFIEVAKLSEARHYASICEAKKTQKLFAPYLDDYKVEKVIHYKVDFMQCDEETEFLD